MDAALARDLELAEVVIGLGLSGRVSGDECAMLMRRLGANATGERMLASVKIERMAVNGSLARARTVLDQAMESGIEVIPLSSDRYPKRLRLLGDAPQCCTSEGKRPRCALRGRRQWSARAEHRLRGSKSRGASPSTFRLMAGRWSAAWRWESTRAAHEGCLTGRCRRSPCWPAGWTGRSQGPMPTSRNGSSSTVGHGCQSNHRARRCETRNWSRATASRSAWLRDRSSSKAPRRAEPSRMRRTASGKGGPCSLSCLTVSRPSAHCLGHWLPRGPPRCRRARTIRQCWKPCCSARQQQETLASTA